MPGGFLRVLDGISLQMSGGERLTIMGPSGSGKSTLLSMLGTLEEPTAGTIRLDGIDPYGLNGNALAAFRNHEIGFVFQDHHLLNGCSAIDNVVLPALAVGRVSDAVASRAHYLLERIGLGKRCHHLPSELSGGERQRVAIARALLLSPRLILADEPTGQLDAQAAVRVTELLVELVSELGGMLVVATHAEAVALRIGTIRTLVDGRLVP